MKQMQKTMSILLGASMLAAAFAFALVLPALATTPHWDTTGDYTVTFEYLGSDYDHNMTLIEDEFGLLTGNGSSQAGTDTYHWNIKDGKVNGDSLELTAEYTAPNDAVYPLTTMHVDGTIDSDGTMSGTWSDNYAGQDRSGTWNTTSGAAWKVGSPTDDSSTVTVMVEKFINGSQATAANAQNADFPMTATWNANNTGAGTGSYTLSDTNTVPYRAMTAQMTRGANYETRELVNGAVVGANCATGKPFALDGYTTGNTRTEALNATPSMAKPTFMNLQNDKFVIVWNRDCSVTEDQNDGQLAGEVVAGDGVLEVTSIQMIDTTAIANGSFNDGWEYVFHITAPMSEENLSMKFDNWLRTGGAGTIPVASNMRISSDQADNGGATILLTGANQYATPELTMVGDLDPTMDGRQVQITVEVAVPFGTPNGTYTTNYGVRSNP